MRILNLIKWDIQFQIKYGFYFVYVIFTLFYIGILFVLPVDIRKKVGTIMIYTDPAAMGLFFMGAIVLLEKSQRVLNSIAVSPVKVSEYMIAKVVSLGAIGTVVGVVIAVVSGLDNMFRVLVGTFLGSIIFSLLGLIAASKSNSLNQFMVATIPFELIGFIPPIFYLFGYQKSYMLLHPGCIVIHLIRGETGNIPILIIMLIIWIYLIFWIAKGILDQMFQSVGGVKL